MTRKALNWIVFSGGALLIILVAAFTLPKLIADEMYPVPEDVLEKINYCKERYSITIDNALVLAVAKKESGFQYDAVSYVGAQGMFQVMPATAAGMEARYDFSGLDSNTKNVCMGVIYLAGGLGTYANSDSKVQLALAAYNGGGGAAAGYPNNMPAETINYVDTIYNVYYPAYQKRLEEIGEGGGGTTSDFIDKKEKLSYLEEILGAVVGDYASDDVKLVDAESIESNNSAIKQTIEVFAKPFYVPEWFN